MFKSPFLISLFFFVGASGLAQEAGTSSQSAHKRTPLKTAILVDKKTNNLHVCDYVDGRYKILKTYHSTLGQVKGDKEDEDDLKTPEGIYTFDHLRTPPNLQKKFGVMAFH